MFDISTVTKEYFTVKLCVRDDDTDEVLKKMEVNVGAPKIKTLKKIMSLAKESNDNDESDKLSGALRLILDKNKEHTKVPEEFIDDLEYDEMLMLYNAFFEWMGNKKSSKN